MKAKLTGSYPTIGKPTSATPNKRLKNNDGSDMNTCTYELAGTPEELAQFKKDQGDKYRENPSTGTPLFFTVDPTALPVGGVATLKKATKSGRYYVDSSAFDRMASVVSKYGGNFGNKLADKMLEDFFGNKQSVSSSISTPVTKEEVAPEVQANAPALDEM